MKSTKASTLSPHAQPFVPSFAVPDNSVFTCYSSPIQPPQESNDILELNYYDCGYDGSTQYYFFDGCSPTPVSASSSVCSSSPNTKLAISPCSTLKKLEIACDLASSDDISLIDSPCYKGRHWSQSSPVHTGETSASPRVTVEKLGEEQNLSVTETSIARLMGSDENAKKKLSVRVPVPVGSLDSELYVGSSGGDPIKQKPDPGSSRREMLLLKMVYGSDMLLKIPSITADLAEGDDVRVKMIIEDLEKLVEKAKKGHLRELARTYRMDEEKGKAPVHSASISQERCHGDNTENIDATLYKSLWINAEIEKCKLKCKLKHVHMVVNTGNNN